MARRHRLLERWLTDTLGLNWTDAHEEAHRLEHALSPRVEDRLAEMLGMPSTCPHGNPIPGMPRPTNREMIVHEVDIPDECGGDPKTPPPGRSRLDL